MAGGSGEFKVTTQVLKSKMDEVIKKISDAQHKLEGMDNLVDSTASYWVGDAGEYHRKAYRELRPEADRILQLWNGHAVHLGQIAGVYEQSEAQAQSTAAALPTDIIS